MTAILFKKLVPVILMAIGGTLFVLVRTVTAWLEKRSGLGNIEKIKKDPATAARVSETHDMVYGQRKNFKASHYTDLKNYILSTGAIGDYVIVYCHEVNAQDFLVFTSLSYQDFDVSLTGKSEDVQKTILIAFTLRYSVDEEILRVFSDIHSNTDQKFQKEGLIRALFPGSY
ncbi:MAG TPA: hypothetical protein VGK59_11010 [Ohtaekwangia sp.]